MKIPRGLAPLTALFACVLAAAPVAAQLRVGGGLGYMFDRDEQFLSLTGEARYRLAGKPVTLNPRLDYFLEDGTSLQVDGNVLVDLAPEANGRLRPFAGGGPAINHYSYETGGEGGTFSQTKVGVNFVVGSILELPNAPVQIFGHAQYTVASDWGNTMVFYAGVLFHVGGAAGGSSM